MLFFKKLNPGGFGPLTIRPKLAIRLSGVVLEVRSVVYRRFLEIGTGQRANSFIDVNYNQNVWSVVSANITINLIRI